VEKAFVFKMKTIHTSSCMVAKKIPFYCLCLYAIYILLQKFVAGIKPGALHLTAEEHRGITSTPSHRCIPRITTLTYNNIEV
jgi:hypothetical protein